MLLKHLAQSLVHGKTLKMVVIYVIVIIIINNNTISL